MSNWEIIKVQDIGQLHNGRAFKPSEWSDQGLPIIRIQNLNGSQDFNYFDGNFESKHEVNYEDLLFAWSGSRGTSFGPYIWKGDRSLLNQHIFKVDLKEGIDKVFIYYMLKRLTSQIEYNAHGSAGLVHITKKELEKFELHLPPLKEQQKIAEILSSVDAAIEKTEQVIAKTEEVKKGLMQQLLTKGIGHTEFKQTEIGEIPVEWKFLPLNKLGEFKNGINKSKEDFGFGSYFVNISDIYANEIIEEHLLGRLNATDKERAVYKLNKGDIVVVRSSVKPEGVGYPILYRGSKEDVLYCGFTIRYRYDQEILFDKYLLHVLRSPRVRMDVLKYASVSANTNINQDSYGKIKIPIPPFEEQIKIAQVIDEVNAKITLEKTKVTRFGVIKQGLMQQLLTGQVRVKVD